jgi:hypothetical protein
LATAVLVVLSLFGASTAAPDAPPPERRQAAEKALTWLLAHAFAGPDASGTPRKPFTLAITGLDLLMARGRTVAPGSGDDLRRVKEALVAYLGDVERRSRDPGSLPAAHGVADSTRLVQYTWVLGASALFFAEAAAQGVFRVEAERALQRIGLVLAEAQDENGGWGHGRVAPAGTPSARPSLLPGRMLGGGYPSTLVSSTSVVALGLALARPSAPRAWDPILARARKHLVDAELPNGNFPYDTSQRSAHADATGVGRTAGALAALLALGVPPTDDPVRRAARFLDDRIAGVAEGHGSPALNVFLAAVAARLRGEEAVRAFERVLLPRILAKQGADGSLDCVCEGTGFGVTCDSPTRGLHAMGPPAFADGQRAYVTALHLFALLLDAPDLLEILRPQKGAPSLPPAPAVTPR